MEEYTIKEKIKYLDVDKNNKLKNRSIINFMQDVAGEHADANGDGLANKNETHVAWLLLNWRIKVVGDRPQNGETIIIKTWVNKMERCYSWREFKIYCNDELVVIARSKWVLVDTESRKITRIPLEWIEKYNSGENSVFENNQVPEKISEPENLKLAYEETIGRTKIDTNNHLNNLYYLDYAIESLPEEVYEKHCFNNIEIMYKKEIKYKDKIKCLYKYEDNEHIVVIKNEDLSVLHAIVKLS